VFGIGLPELVLILALALIVLGPEKLPKVARQLARFVGELKRMGEDFKRQVDLESLKEFKDPASWGMADQEEDKRPVVPGAGRQPDHSDLDQRDKEPGGAGPEWKRAEKGLDSGAKAEPEGSGPVEEDMQGAPPGETGTPPEGVGTKTQG
jgi:Tat protein translocase TatB subunit